MKKLLTIIVAVIVAPFLVAAMAYEVIIRADDMDAMPIEEDANND